MAFHAASLIVTSNFSGGWAGAARHPNSTMPAVLAPAKAPKLAKGVFPTDAAAVAGAGKSAAPVKASSTAAKRAPAKRSATKRAGAKKATVKRGAKKR